MCILDPRLTDVQLVANLLRTAAALMHLEVWVHFTKHISHRVESHLKARNWDPHLFPPRHSSTFNVSMAKLLNVLSTLVPSTGQSQETFWNSPIFGRFRPWSPLDPMRQCNAPRWGRSSAWRGFSIRKRSPRLSLVNLWTWYKLLQKLSSWICRGDRARKFLGLFVSHSPRFSRPGAVQDTRTLPHLQNDPHIGNPSQQLKVSCLNSVCACFSHSAFVIHRETSKGTSHHPLETRRCCQKRMSTHTHKSCKVTTCKAWNAHCCYGGVALVRKKLPRGGSQYSRSYRIWKQIHVNSFDQE